MRRVPTPTSPRISVVDLVIGPSKFLQAMLQNGINWTEFSKSMLAGHLDDIRPRRERTRQDDYLYYSLAGPPESPPRYDQHQTYFDAGYLYANPWMQDDDDSPIFTLARNFARIVRWKGGKGNHNNIKANEKGERETAS